MSGIVMIIVMFLVYVLFALLCVMICRCTKYSVPTVTWFRVRAFKVYSETFSPPVLVDQVKLSRTNVPYLCKTEDNAADCASGGRLQVKRQDRS